MHKMFYKSAVFVYETKIVKKCKINIDSVKNICYHIISQVISEIKTKRGQYDERQRIRRT